MGVGAALKEYAKEHPAALLLFCALVTWANGAMSGQLANAWWINTRGREWHQTEAARYGEAMDRMERIEKRIRYLEEDRDAVRRLELKVDKLDGRMDILIEQRRGRR